MCERNIDQGPSPQPRHVALPGIEPPTFQLSGQRSVHWETPARANDFLFNFEFEAVWVMLFYLLYLDSGNHLNLYPRFKNSISNSLKGNWSGKSNTDSNPVLSEGWVSISHVGVLPCMLYTVRVIQDGLKIVVCKGECQEELIRRDSTPAGH